MVLGDVSDRTGHTDQKRGRSLILTRPLHLDAVTHRQSIDARFLRPLDEGRLGSAVDLPSAADAEMFESYGDGRESDRAPCMYFVEEGRDCGNSCIRR